MMTSHNNFDNPTPAIFDRHPQSPSPTTSSTPNYLTTTPSVLAFAQPTVSPNVHCSVDGRQTSSPTPPHQNPSLRISQPSADSGLLVIDGQPQPIEAVQNLITSLRHEIALRDDQIAYMTSEIEGLRRIVGERNRDVDQLRSVLDQKYIPITMNNQTFAKNLGLGHLQSGCEPIMETEDGYTGQISRMTPPPPSFVPARVKKQGVSGESVSRNGNIGFIHYEKDQNSRRSIYNAISSNDFLNNLEHSQIEEIVLCMYEKRVNKGCFVIREGEPGDALYVTAEGIVEVLKGNQVIGQMEVGRAFGEMALLYNCNRTASVRALTNAKFWTLDRRVYQQIMMNSSLHKHKENLQFLMSVSDFKNLSQRKLHKLADVLELIYYPGNEYIIRQGEVGETFFIIHSGQVKITQSKYPGEPPQEIRVLGSGEWFGERALYTRDKRSANVVALPPGVHVLCLDRSNFIHLIGDLSEIKSKEYGDFNRGVLSHSPAADAEDLFCSGDKRHSDASQICGDDELAATTGMYPVSLPAPPVIFKSGTAVVDGQASIAGAPTHLAAGRQTIQYEDLISVAILGIGGFGRVELVVLKHDRNKSFALKCMKKQHIVETRQQDHIFSERNLMFEIRSPFVCRLYATYRDNKYVYMLLEACLGGEIWTILRNRGNFDDTITRFIVASVLEAFTYLHTNHIIYRDLKPENLLLDERGYIKLCDFGFAKKINPGKKTWTFCGTPEYVAPEIILNKGHDHSADYWSLGILMFELLTGSPPFTGMDPMKIYNIILRGIDAIMFPPFQINRTATALIHRLCTQNPVERLGYGRGGIVDIKQHKYFQGFDWIGLCRGTLQAPIVPKISGPTDVSNFDRYPDQMEVPPDELSGWDAEF